MTNKRLTAVTLALCLLLTLLPLPVRADETSDETTATSGICGYSLTWTLDDSGVLTINGEGAMTDYTNYSDTPWYSQSRIHHKRYHQRWRDRH